MIFPEESRPCMWLFNHQLRRKVSLDLLNISTPYKTVFTAFRMFDFHSVFYVLFSCVAVSEQNVCCLNFATGETEKKASDDMKQNKCLCVIL